MIVLLLYQSISLATC